MVITFGMLAASICTVWLKPIGIGSRHRILPWLALFSAALIAGILERVLTWPALAALAALGMVAYLSSWSQETGRLQRALYDGLTLSLALALALHVLPGFNNPVLFTNIQFSPNAVPFTQHANFDTAAVGLILLALIVNRSRNEVNLPPLWRMVPIAAVTTAIVIAAAMAVGYVRPDPKLSAYTPIFLVINLLFVCVMEEAFFRGFLQHRISQLLADTWWGETIAVLGPALLFGIAHLGGGWLYVGLATIAGIGYGYAYLVTRRIEAAILTHFSLNAVHFVGFTYPRLL